MNFKKVNNTAGWVVCVIASLVYILTAEKAGSFWDCGEFVSACYKVQMPHPPGAPLFVLLGRFFIILFGDNPMTAAKAVNDMNALASGFTILFLFWTITHFARKLMSGLMTEPTKQQMYVIIGAGVVGALAYTFTDSFWFSAVEGEVYAFSSFFTGLAFWAMLKWEHADIAAANDRAARNRADRWIVFLFFSLGLSIGVHLLGLLTIPAVVMIYYYRRYTYTRKGAIWAFILGCVITGMVQVAIIQWSIKFAGAFDIFFVNSLGLPFFSGFSFFFILLAVLVWLGLRWAKKNNWSFLRLGLWSFAFMMLGYSTYLTTMERSNADPALDMNNVDNPMSLVYYLGREQYGSQPIVYGPHYAAQYKYDDQGQVVTTEGKMRYAKGNNHYVELGRESNPQYKSRDVQLFPRVWDAQNDQQHVDFYMQWLNLGQISAKELSQVVQVDDDNGIIVTVNQAGKQETYQLPDNFRPHVRRGQIVQQGSPLAIQAPSYADNIKWFFTYQMGFMYWRYFMWNFSGRQNDLQGYGNKRDGNWITGIPLIDNTMLGDQSKLPDSIKHNGATNKLFLLPFLLGIIGCVYHFIRDRKDFVISFLLFFFTGIAIVIYLNQAGNQPRERDYAFAGSFYAYAIWIGLSVVAFARMAQEQTDKLTFKNVLVYGSILTFAVTLMSISYGSGSAALIVPIMITAVYAAVTAIITYAVRAVSKNNLRTAALTATAFCLLAPIIMGAQEWDDHDRSKKTLAPDIAKDYLESCPKNAVLFTFGDNDTYPLWYAQEVEGVRPDIRILNTSLLGIDWYVNQMRYKVNESGPIDVIWNEDQIRNLQVVYSGQPDNANQTQSLYDFMKNTIGPKLNAEDKSQVQVSFPAHLTVPVDTAYVRKAGLVTPQDSLSTQIDLTISSGKSYYTLDQLTMLNVLAATNWKRPICFTNPYQQMGFGPYLRQEGLIFRLVPVANNKKPLAINKTDSLLQTKFRSGGANIPGVYFDEENRTHLLAIRQTFAMAADALANEGRKEEAIKLLKKSESLIIPQDLPYAMVSNRPSPNFHNRVSMFYLQAAYKAGYMELANKISQALRKDFNDQRAYYKYMRENHEESYAYFANDDQDCDQYLKQLDDMQKIFNPPNIIHENPGKLNNAADSSKKDTVKKK